MKKRVLFVLPLVLLFFNCSKKQNAFQIVKELGAVDKVVGLDSKTKGYWNLYLMRKTNPELADLPVK